MINGHNVCISKQKKLVCAGGNRFACQVLGQVRVISISRDWCHVVTDFRTLVVLVIHPSPHRLELIVAVTVQALSVVLLCVSKVLL